MPRSVRMTRGALGLRLQLAPQPDDLHVDAMLAN
jgi:hypothetical protein